MGVDCGARSISFGYKKRLSLYALVGVILLANPIILFNKPYGVLSQFTPEDGHPGLSSLLDLPGYRVAGRLDRDSEGLLILTDNGAVQARIAEPRYRSVKTYWAQVEGQPDLTQWTQPLTLKDGSARFLSARVIPDPTLWRRDPPIRVRPSIPDTWVSVSLDEGRNRQVRRMTAALGHPTLRLIRMASGPFELDDLLPGEQRSVPIPNAWENLASKPKIARVRRPTKQRRR